MRQVLSLGTWFDLTKGAFEQMADLEMGMLKGLKYERVRDEAVKDRQHQLNHDLTSRSQPSGDGSVAQARTERMRRGKYDSRKAGDLAGDSESSNSGSSFLLDSILGALGSSAPPRRAPPSPSYGNWPRSH